MSPTTPSSPSVDQKLPACEIEISQPLIDAYAAISGDYNPIHVDQKAAAASPFGGTIAHGCIPLEPIFQAVERWLGCEALPPSTVLSLRYKAPSRPGDTIRAEALVTSELAGVVAITFACVNQRGERVIEGECRCPREARR